MIEVTQEGRELAAELANVEAKLGLTPKNWIARDFTNGCCASDTAALARRATQFLADKSALADLQASYDAAVGDLAEAAAAIDDALPWMEAPKATSAKQRARLEAIAAKYRVETDPLVEALDALEWTVIPSTFADRLRTELAKRGIELAKVTV